MATPRVLISEADPHVRRLLGVLIERRGHEAVVLGSDVVVPPRADVLLVDPAAPQGACHARLVREFYPRLPVVCLDLLRHGALPGDGPVEFLAKPFEPDALDAVLDGVLGLAASPG